MKIADGSVIEPPFPLHPFDLSGVNSFHTLKIIIQLIKGEAAQDLLVRVEKSDVQDAVVAAIPYLIILKKTCRLFFSNLNIQKIPGFLVGDGNEVFVPQEGKDTDNQSNQK